MFLHHGPVRTLCEVAKPGVYPDALFVSFTNDGCKWIEIFESRGDRLGKPLAVIEHLLVSVFNKQDDKMNVRLLAVFDKGLRGRVVVRS